MMSRNRSCTSISGVSSPRARSFRKSAICNSPTRSMAAASALEKTTSNSASIAITNSTAPSPISETQFALHRPELLQCKLQVFARMRGADLGADARLSLRHHGEGKADDVDAAHEHRL